MKKLKRVYIEITSVCNLSCSFCPKTARPKKFLSVEEYAHILNNVSHLTDHIYLHVMGEPTLHPNLGEFLKLAKEKNLNVNLTTNGTQIVKVQNELLEYAPRKISFSLHSYEGNNSNISLENYLTPILNFSKLALEKNMIVEFRLWNYSENLEAKNKLNTQIIEHIATSFNLDKNTLLNLKKEGGIKLSNNCYLGFDNVFMWPDEKLNLNYEEVYCLALKNQVAILVDGTVVPCCLDYNASIKLGNIFESTLEEILNSEFGKSMLKGFQNRSPICSLCKNCGYAKQKFL